MKEEFEVKVEDLSKYSYAEITIQCDYCGKVFKTKWYNYYPTYINETYKDCCSNPECTGKKSRDVIYNKYGVYGVHNIPGAKEKVAQTNLKNLGYENPFSSPDIQEKIKQKNMLRYGVEIPTQNPKIRAKAVETSLKKYGAVSYGVIYGREHAGELSPTWKGGVSHHRVERATIEYRQWRKAVFENNLYTCQCCGNKSSKDNKVELHAHHINNWKDNIDLRYKIDNGITLCDKCHYLFHSIYGKHNNTEVQLSEFLNKHR